MSVHHHSNEHVSRVDIPCVLYGSVGVGVALAMQVVGLLKNGDERLLGALLNPVFHGEMPGVLSLPVQLLITVVCCYGLAFIVLDSAGTWRRLLMGVTVLILVLAMVPTLAVWNIYFSPFLAAVGVFWTWFCTMMYVSHHHMPCEIQPAPASILTVSSAYKQPAAAVVEAEEPKEEKAQVQPVKKPIDLEKDRLKKYQPKEMDVVSVKEKANG